MLSSNPTKNEEIAFYENFVNGLPRGSYLREMLRETVGTVTNNIRNDFAFDPLTELMRQQAEEKTQLAGLVTARKEAVAELERIRRDIDAAERTMEGLRHKARQILEV